MGNQKEAPSIGLMYANVGVGASRDAPAKIADAVLDSPIDSVWAVDHVVIPSELGSSYPYSRSGRLPRAPDSDYLDPLLWLTRFGSVCPSEDVKLGTGIYILPLRHPIQVAKLTATVTRLVGERLILGVGVGWLEEEFEALDLEFSERGGMTSEAIEVLNKLWASPAAHAGEYWEFFEVHCMPRPPSSIPIVVGGQSIPAARRAGTLGDGFFPARPTGAADLIERARGFAEEAGKDPSGLEITVGLPSDDKTLEELLQVGVDRFAVPMPQVSGDNLPEAIRETVGEAVWRVEEFGTH